MDSKTPEDRYEPLSALEPVRLAEGTLHRPALTDLALELAQRSAGFRRSLPATLTGSLADLVRSMNCYYSNLIEGHNTHPVDIERALKGDYSGDATKRNLQLEAQAHIMVQRWIDGAGLTAPATSATSLRTIHRRFCEHLPPELLSVEDPLTRSHLPVVPGEFRTRDVVVGQHLAVSAGAVPRFLQRFEEAYAPLGKTETILATAAMHHRMLWIHPFLDGNGRVARLMSHATLIHTLETGGLWSIARGLARNVAAYKAHLTACDQPRRNDIDGRGQLSEENLVEFTRFFLSTCLDQVTFMERLMQPDRLRARILQWADLEVRTNALPQRAQSVLEALLYRGELPRGDLPGIVGTGDRQSRRVVTALADTGVVVSESSRAPLRLAFPAKLASQWMPGLFPEQVTS